MIEIPTILNIPPKLTSIITNLNNYRYFLLTGGRGGGKSQTVARLILYLAEKYQSRIVCGREIQNSIQESVYSLLSDIIKSYRLDFEIYSSKIVSRQSNSTLNFRGFREQGAFNIQGMEGVDIVWIDEAQAITQQTLDVLIPTVRKDNAKLFFTMNRHVHNDPVFEFLKGRDDCLHININYNENPFCTEALIKEAEECKKRSLDDFEHIWQGVPMKMGDNCVFSHDELVQSKENIYPLRPSYGLRLAGFDVARFGDDKSACVIIEQRGALNWEQIFACQWGKQDLVYTTGKILSLCQEWGVQKAVIDEDGIGAGALDNLNVGREMKNFTGFRNPPISYQEDKFYANRRTKYTYKLKDMLLKGQIRLTDDDLIDELETIRYKFDNQQRRILVSKDEMKSKYKTKSPNLADALIMSLSLLDDIKTGQDRQYSFNQQMSSDGDLFKIAGIR